MSSGFTLTQVEAGRFQNQMDPVRVRRSGLGLKHLVLFCCFKKIQWSHVQTVFSGCWGCFNAPIQLR